MEASLLAWLIPLHKGGEARRGNCSSSGAFRREGRMTVCFCRCGFHGGIGTGGAALRLLIVLVCSKVVEHIMNHSVRVCALGRPYRHAACCGLAEPTPRCIRIPIPNSLSRHELVAHGLTLRVTQLNLWCPRAVKLFTVTGRYARWHSVSWLSARSTQCLHLAGPTSLRWLAPRQRA